ncbi:hypothetical protein AB205_0162630, partial [Aquarana catesbeiana]
ICTSPSAHSSKHKCRDTTRKCPPLLSKIVQQLPLLSRLSLMLSKHALGMPVTHTHMPPVCSVSLLQLYAAEKSAPYTFTQPALWALNHADAALRPRPPFLRPPTMPPPSFSKETGFPRERGSDPTGSHGERRGIPPTDPCSFCLLERSCGGTFKREKKNPSHILPGAWAGGSMQLVTQSETDKHGI